MKTRITNSSLILGLAAGAIISFAGCATRKRPIQTRPNRYFRRPASGCTLPQTVKQHELYAALPSNKVERGTVKGKVFYVFKDEKAGVAYVGGEPEHQRYQQLCMQQHVAQPAEEEMKHPFAQNWSNQWGPVREPW